MKAVGVAELKSRLSEYLRMVRRGEALTVKDRETPIARIVPYDGSPVALAIRRPRPGTARPGRVRLPPPLRIRGDIVSLLLAERQVER